MGRDLNQLAEDAGALMHATAELAGDEVAEARKRVAAGLDRARGLYEELQEQAVAGARVVDATVHRHPYPGIAVGFGLGVLVGVFLTSRCGRTHE